MTQAGSVPPPPPKGGYHVWGFDPKGADKKNLTLAGLIMEGFMKVIDDFKKSIGQSSAQLKKIDALMKDANALFNLINQVTSPKTTDLKALYGKIQSAMKTLQDQIYKTKDPNWKPGDKPPTFIDGSYLYELNKQLNGVKAAITDKPFVSIFKSYIKMANELKSDLEKIWKGESVNADSFYNLVFNLNGVGKQLGQLETALNNKAIWDKGVPNPIKDAVNDWNSWWSKMLGLRPLLRFFHPIYWIVTAHNSKEGESRAKTWIKEMSEPGGGFRGDAAARDYVEGLFTQLSKAMISDGNKVTVSPTTVLTWIRRMNGPDKEVNWTWVNAADLRSQMAGLWKLWTTGRSDSEQMISTTGTFSNSTITNINKGYTGINTVATVMAKMVNVPIRNVNRALENLRKGL